MVSLGVADDDSRYSFNDHSKGFSQQSDCIDYEKLDAVVVYEWPLNSGELYFIEEYLADYLKIKSVRRTYAAIERRRIQALDEREYLLSQGIVNELQCDLGVIALPAEQVYRLMAPDFPRKFEFYDETKTQQDYEEIVSTSWQANATCAQLSAEELKSAATRTCASWNKVTNKTVKNERWNDTARQTGIRWQRKLQSSDRHNVETKKVSHFPLAIVPGQFVDHPSRFSSNILLRLPLNTVVQGPQLNASIAVDSELRKKDECGTVAAGEDSDTDFHESSSPSVCWNDCHQYTMRRTSTSSSTLTVPETSSDLFGEFDFTE